MPWFHLMNSRKILLRIKRIHKVEPKREIPLCRIDQHSLGNEKKTASSRNFLKLKKNDQRYFLVEIKQEILKMCHFPRIERKFRWNQYQKVLILIPANQFLNGVISSKTEHKNYCSRLQNELHQVRQYFSIWQQFAIHEVSL